MKPAIAMTYATLFRCQVLWLTLGLLVVGQAGHAEAQALEVTPSDRVTHFVNIRDAPSTNGERVARLHPGERLPWVESVPRWHEVRLADGRSGFVSKSWTIVVPAQPPTSPDVLRIHFLSIGAGTCTVVECPGPDAPPMIVDCGSSGGRGENALEKEQARERVQAILASHTSAPNVVLSHGDKDHYNWVPVILEGITVQNIWQGGDADTYGVAPFPDWLESQKMQDATLHEDLDDHWHNDGEPLGEGLSCGLASTFVLTVNSGGSKNTDSLVLMIEYEDFTAIFPGDAVKITEEFAIANFSEAIKTTVLAASHHGAESHGSNHHYWAKQTAPEVVIYSSGRLHGHPRCTPTEEYHPYLEPAPAHTTHCNDTNDYEQRQISESELAEYVTDVVGSILVTSNGQPPLHLTCDAAPGCNAQIMH